MPHERLTLEITFYPPNNHRRDMDNMIAALKPSIDGIADATGIDDSRFHIGHAVGDARKNGEVLVEVFA